MRPSVLVLNRVGTLFAEVLLARSRIVARFGDPHALDG